MGKPGPILYLRRIIVFVAISWALVSPLRADSSSCGNDFWLTFPAGVNSSYRKIGLIISSEVSTSGTVQIAILGFSQSFTVPAGGTTIIQLPNCQIIQTDGMVNGLGINVTSLDPVAVYGLNFLKYGTDGYLGFPVSALGTNYIIQSYPTGGYGTELGSEFAVVSTQNGTVVVITPSATTGIRTAGVPYTVTLNQGDVYQLAAIEHGVDLTGTVVSANQPIAVFGANQIVNVPETANTANMLLEQLWPTSGWGVEFYTMPLASRSNGDTFRFLAMMDNTTVQVNGAAVATLGSNQFLEQILSTSSRITANNPIFVMQYSNGRSFDGAANADPFMMSIAAVNQYDTDYIVGMPASDFTYNYENIIVPDSAVGSIMLDGAVIPPSGFIPIGSSGYSGAAITVNVGTHHLTSSLPFGVSAYGYDMDDGYGYPGGILMSSVGIPTPTWTSSPTPTSSPTLTPSPTTTETTTVTPTDTLTATFTLTPTYTPTGTPTPTAKLSNTVSATPTPTFTSTRTRTPPHNGCDTFFISNNSFYVPVRKKTIFLIILCEPGLSGLIIYNTAGEKVKVLKARSFQSLKELSLDWDGTNDRGEPVAAGVYLIRFEGQRDSLTRLLAVIR